MTLNKTPVNPFLILRKTQTMHTEERIIFPVSQGKSQINIKPIPHSNYAWISKFKQN